MTNVARKDRDITLTFYAPSVMPTTLNVTFIRSVPGTGMEIGSWIWGNERNWSTECAEWTMDKQQLQPTDS